MRHLIDNRGRIDTAAPFYGLVLEIDEIFRARTAAARWGGPAAVPAPTPPAGSVGAGT
jgi:hypothetical protein